MKLLLSTFFFISASWALQNPYYANSIEGYREYVSDNSGRYIHDDSGRYIPDRSGDYLHDGLGGYTGDGSGNYKGDASGIYKGDRNGYFGNGKEVHIGGRRINRGFNENLLGLGTTQPQKAIKILNTGNSNLHGTGQGGSRYADGKWRIIRQSGDVDTDGYHWLYETENRILAEESGKLANKGTDAEVMRAKGFYEYTGPDNVVYRVEYTADENGFLAEGEHLPTSPPIPIAIARSLGKQ